MNRTTQAFISALFILFIHSRVHAESLYWPQDCDCAQVQTTNSTSSSIRYWLQKKSPYVVDQIEYEIPAHKKIEHTVCRESKTDSYNLLHFEVPKAVLATINCNNKIYQAVDYTGGIQTYTRIQNESFKIWLRSLSYEKQTLKFKFYNSWNRLLREKTLDLEALNELKTEFSEKDFKYIKITSNQRWTSAQITNQSFKPATVSAHDKSPTEENSKYFLVGPRDSIGDQFVVKISDPEMIEKARDQIKDPTLEKIVFGKVQMGHQNYNRNWSRIEKPYWSWSISEVTNISDFGSTACNGFPQLVEDYLLPWLENPGRICFWNYRIKKEITP